MSKFNGIDMGTKKKLSEKEKLDEMVKSLSMSERIVLNSLLVANIEKEIGDYLYNFKINLDKLEELRAVIWKQIKFKEERKEK